MLPETRPGDQGGQDRDEIQDQQGGPRADPVERREDQLITNGKSEDTGDAQKPESMIYGERERTITERPDDHDKNHGGEHAAGDVHERRPIALAGGGERQ